MRNPDRSCASLEAMLRILDFILYSEASGGFQPERETRSAYDSKEALCLLGGGGGEE